MNTHQQEPGNAVILARLGAAQLVGGDDDSLPPVVEAFAADCEAINKDPQAQILREKFAAGKLSREDFDAEMAHLFGKKH